MSVEISKDNCWHYVGNCDSLELAPDRGLNICTFKVRGRLSQLDFVKGVFELSRDNIEFVTARFHGQNILHFIVKRIPRETHLYFDSVYEMEVEVEVMSEYQEYEDDKRIAFKVKNRLRKSAGLQL